MSAPELARALEERGFESVWAPEHSHIPLSRKTPFPGGGDLPKPYYDAMDPFVVLAAAAQATRKIKIGTGVVLIQQRDAIQTAKLVASIDQVSQGRFWIFAQPRSSSISPRSCSSNFFRRAELLGSCMVRC